MDDDDDDDDDRLWWRNVPSKYTELFEDNKKSLLLHQLLGELQKQQKERARLFVIPDQRLAGRRRFARVYEDTDSDESDNDAATISSSATRGKRGTRHGSVGLSDDQYTDAWQSARNEMDHGGLTFVQVLNKTRLMLMHGKRFTQIDVEASTALDEPEAKQRYFVLETEDEAVEGCPPHIVQVFIKNYPRDNGPIAYLSLHKFKSTKGGGVLGASVPRWLGDAINGDSVEMIPASKKKHRPVYPLSGVIAIPMGAATAWHALVKYNKKTKQGQYAVLREQPFAARMLQLASELSAARQRCWSLEHENTHASLVKRLTDVFFIVRSCVTCSLYEQSALSKQPGRLQERDPLPREVTKFHTVLRLGKVGDPHRMCHLRHRDKLPGVSGTEKREILEHMPADTNVTGCMTPVHVAVQEYDTPRTNNTIKGLVPVAPGVLMDIAFMADVGNCTALSAALWSLTRPHNPEEETRGDKEFNVKKIEQVRWVAFPDYNDEEMDIAALYQSDGILTLVNYKYHIQYLVHWDGYTTESNSWSRSDTHEVQAGGDSEIDDFWERRYGMSRAQGEVAFACQVALPFLKTLTERDMEELLNDAGLNDDSYAKRYANMMSPVPWCFDKGDDRDKHEPHLLFSKEQRKPDEIKAEKEHRLAQYKDTLALLCALKESALYDEKDDYLAKFVAQGGSEIKLHELHMQIGAATHAVLEYRAVKKATELKAPACAAPNYFCKNVECKNKKDLDQKSTAVFPPLLSAPETWPNAPRSYKKIVQACASTAMETCFRFDNNTRLCIDKFLKTHAYFKNDRKGYSVVAAEYPVHQPFGLACKNRAKAPQFVATRIDALIRTKVKGQLIVVEYKELMETGKSPAEHENGTNSDSRARRVCQRLVNRADAKQAMIGAFLFHATTGIRPDYVMTVHATRATSARSGEKIPEQNLHAFMRGAVRCTKYTLDGTIYPERAHLIANLICRPLGAASHTCYVDEHYFVPSLRDLIESNASLKSISNAHERGAAALFHVRPSTLMNNVHKDVVHAIDERTRLVNWMPMMRFFSLPGASLPDARLAPRPFYILDDLTKHQSYFAKKQKDAYDARKWCSHVAWLGHAWNCALYNCKDVDALTKLLQWHTLSNQENKTEPATAIIPMLPFTEANDSHGVSRYVIPLFAPDIDSIKKAIGDKVDKLGPAAFFEQWLNPAITASTGLAYAVPARGVALPTAAPLELPPEDRGATLYCTEDDLADTERGRTLLDLRKQLCEQVWDSANSLARFVRVWLRARVGTPPSSEPISRAGTEPLPFGAHLWQALLLFRELRPVEDVELDADTDDARQARVFDAEGRSLVPEYVYGEEDSDSVDGGYPGADVYTRTSLICHKDLVQMLARTLHRTINLRVMRAFFPTEFITTVHTVAHRSSKRLQYVDRGPGAVDALELDAAAACRELHVPSTDTPLVGGPPKCAGVALNLADAARMRRGDDISARRNAQDKLYQSDNAYASATRNERARGLQRFLHCSRRTDWSRAALMLGLRGNGDPLRESPVAEAATDLENHIDTALPIIIGLTAQRGTPRNDARRFATSVRREQNAARFMGLESFEMARWQRRGR